MYMAIRIMEREVGTLSNVLRDEMVKTSSSEALQQNRQFLASLTVPQVHHTHTRTRTHTHQGRRRWGGWGRSGCPSFFAVVR